MQILRITALAATLAGPLSPVPVWAQAHAPAANAGGKEPGVASQPTKPDSVEFRYGWPNGLRMEVISTLRRRKVAAGQDQSTTADVSYNFEVSDHVQGQLVRQTDLQPRAAAGEEPELPRILESLQNAMPALVIDNKGKIVDVVGAGKLVEDFTQRLSSGLGEGAEAEAAIGALQQSVLTDIALGNQSRELWEAIVGLWVGGSFRIGTTYEAREDGASPLTPEESLTLIHRFQVTGHVPCTAEDNEHRCVEIQLLSMPDPVSKERSLERTTEFVRSLVPEEQRAQVPVYEAFDYGESKLLITEPDTLIPYKLVQNQSLEIRMRGPEDTFEVKDVSSSEILFRPTRPASKKGS